MSALAKHPTPTTDPDPDPDPDPRSIHAQAIKNPTTDLSIFNNLITLYSKSQHHLPYALRLFHHHLPSPPTVVSWTALISSHSNSPTSLHHFLSMLRHPLRILPNQRTFASLFKTCASLPSLSVGLQLHSLSLKLYLSSQPFSGSSLVHFYAKNKLPCDARKAFDEIPRKDEVCFSSIIVGLAQNSKPIKALSYFADMRVAGFCSNMYSVSAALRAAAELAALEQCRLVHGHCVVTGLDLNVIVGTALVDGYGKCGLVREARGLFDDLMPTLNVIGWNAMLSGYAQQGDKGSAVELFRLMEDHGFVPDEYSFLAVMTAFCNAGLATETEWWLKKMETDYELEPWLEHYTCLVGVMGRVGKFEDAKKIALTMPYKPDAALWRALLSTCRDHEAVDVAWEMSSKLLELDPQDDSAYVIAANVFSKAGRWDQAQEVRKLMNDRRVKKGGGLSWIEVCGGVHVFLAGDKKHERTDEIYAKLAELMEEILKLGYVPIWNEILHEVGKGEKREALLYHSEKLALAFGLVSGAAPPGKALRIVKNLRICRDCHEAFKYISRVVDREIIVRDVNRYHRFLCGSCTCGDCW